MCVGLARSELGDRHNDEALLVTLVPEVVLPGCAAPVGRQRSPYARAAYHAGVRLPVLLVHYHVDYRVHARGEVEEEVAQHVARCND